MTTARPKGFSSKLEHSLGALRQRNFRNFILSSVALGFGQWFQQIGLGWLVFQSTGDAAQMGAIAGVRGLVVLVLSPLAGALSDRVNRRSLIVISTGVTLVQALGLAVLVGTDLIQLWHIYLFSFIEGAASSVNQPARQAFVGDVVGREGLSRAVPLNSMAQNIARISGPAIAGMVIGFAGTASVFYILAGLKVIAMAFTMMIAASTHQVMASKDESALETLGQGVHYSMTNKAILGMLIVSCIPALVIYPYVQFLPFFADRLHGGAQSYGILATGVGWGAIVGLSVLIALGEFNRKGVVMLVSQAIYPLMVACFALSSSFLWAMVFLVLAGIANSINTTLQNTLTLLLSREDMRGRVMSLYSMAGGGLQPLGSFTMGVAIQQWGASEAVVGFMLASIGLVVVSAAVFGAVRRA